MDSKTCTKCGEEKPLDQYSQNGKRADGSQKYRPDCKDCVRERYAAYYRKHGERIRSNVSAYRKENPHKVRETRARHYRENREEILAYHARLRIERADELRERRAARYAENPDKYREAQAPRNRRYRARKAAVQENYTAADKAYTMDLFNHQCFRCNAEDNLAIDHHYPLSKGHALTRENAVVLCRSCNSSKGDKLPEDFYRGWEIAVLEALLGISNTNS